jgi:hypothetical protein
MGNRAEELSSDLYQLSPNIFSSNFLAFVLIFSHAGYDGIVSSLSSDLMQKTAACIHSHLFF